MDPKNIGKIVVYDDVQIANLPSSGQWTRTGLQHGTYVDLDRFRARIDTNSIQWTHEVTISNPANATDTTTFKLLTRVDLCGSQPGAAHAGVQVPHAQVTYLIRPAIPATSQKPEQPKQNFKVEQAFQVAEVDIKAAIDDIHMPQGVQAWLMGIIPTAVGATFPAPHVVMVEKLSRFALKGNPGPDQKYRLLPKQLMEWDFKTSNLPAWEKFAQP